MLDDGRSRALWIPRSHNCQAILRAFRGQSSWSGCAAKPSATARYSGRRGSKRSSVPRWQLCSACGTKTIIARSAVLATGAEDVQAPISDLHGAIQRGIVRHCPTCDAYEVRDRRIAILGAGKCRLQEALLLRSYTSS